jgi:MFS family permease
MRRAHFADEDQIILPQQNLENQLNQPLLEREPSQLFTPFSGQPPPRQAGGVLRDKHGKYRTLYDQRARTTVLVNLAGILERSNEQTLPALYKYVGRSFKATPRQLGLVTLGCALVQAITSPIGGLLGHYYNRVIILSIGCFVWASMAAGFAITHSVATGALFWAFNGFGLALLIPNAQSLIADYFKPVSRGSAFGALQMTGALGGMAGALFATNIGHLQIQIFEYLIEGWRLAFFSVAFLSTVVGVLNLIFSVDPRYKLEEPQYAQAPDIYKQRPISVGRMTADVVSVLAVPSFILIVVQGIVGSAPWNALVWNTLYLQLLGFTDFQASLIASLFLAGTALGGLIGGLLGDLASKRSPNHGRVLMAQFSVGCGVPMSAIVYKLLPASSGPGMLWLYGSIFFLFGTFISWAGPACTSPVFGDIVPAQQRSIIYSFDRAFEGAIASMAAPVVGWIAERMGFSTDDDPGDDGGSSKDLESAAALGDAMLICTAIPWAICALLYSGLHITYRRDRMAAKAYQRARSGFMSVSTIPSITDIVEEGERGEEAEEEAEEELMTEEEEERALEAALAAMRSRRGERGSGGAWMGREV